MNQAEFEEAYARRSGLSRDQIFRPGSQVAMRCACGDVHCSGWAAVTDSPLAIRAHVQLYQRELTPSTVSAERG